MPPRPAAPATDARSPWGFKSGFTLIDLLIVLSLLALLSTLAMPDFSRLLERQRLTGATNALLAHLHFARNQAIALGQPVSACPSRDGRQCEAGGRWEHGWIIHVDRRGQAGPLAEEDLLRVVTGHPGFIMQSGQRQRVRFTPAGMAYGSNLTIRICRSPARAGRRDGRRVIVSNPGRIHSRPLADPADCALPAV